MLGGNDHVAHELGQTTDHKRRPNQPATPALPRRRQVQRMAILGKNSPLRKINLRSQAWIPELSGWDGTDADPARQSTARRGPFASWDHLHGSSGMLAVQEQRLLDRTEAADQCQPCQQ